MRHLFPVVAQDLLASLNVQRVANSKNTRTKPALDGTACYYAPSGVGVLSESAFTAIGAGTSRARVWFLTAVPV
jgi:hypothetical protein